MRLDLSTWTEVEAYLQHSDGIIVPTGSTEQHGPIGLIGTDTLCARAVAEGAGDLAGALVAPDVGYTPAPFNMAFPLTTAARSRMCPPIPRPNSLDDEEWKVRPKKIRVICISTPAATDDPELNT